MPKITFRMIAVALLATLAVSGQVRVRGYVRRDGAYVQPHYRSSPDGSFNNNWSTKGNANPYTGQPGTRVTPPPVSPAPAFRPLLDYYRAIPPSPEPRITAPSKSSPMRVPWVEPAGLDKLPALEEALPPEELARSDRYCEWLYGMDDPSISNCRGQQRRVLASLVLPDYSSLPASEVERGGRYCEWLYGDNRASFYDCFNRQTLGLMKPEATFSAVTPTSESSRSERYCEWLYGNDRASHRDCIETQARQLQALLPVNGDDLPSKEWQRAQHYCEWLYGDNRGSAIQCLNDQARALRQLAQRGTFNKAPTERAQSYCEWLYGDNRASYWSCLASR